ncbi:hypothetical protein FT663_00711 [Candidozyma haemuli var. vulneris]|nr:hypothetical protein FT662_01140 [[Candida] haemuloni var. vulneris]KAF3995168.1 hypothetical protein FT663_00711 [[Candida] haemuloni var. vulneris]
MARKAVRQQDPEPQLDPKKDGNNEENEEEEDYDEDEDEDYDPEKKQQDEEHESEASDNEPEPDYSAINTGVSQVRTRTQRYEEELGGGAKKRRLDPSGLLQDESKVDVNAIFEALKSGKDDSDWTKLIDKDAVPEEKPQEPTTEDPHETRMVRIETSYTFAGKLVKESKLVKADSAEAKAYLNSTSGITLAGEGEGQRKSFVTVIRQIKGTEEQVPLMIKLKRPSLIDKFLQGDKKNKLTTLEKSRLDWASYVDEEKIKDDLELHNKAGYLDKQDFLGRMDARRDVQYQKAKELERQRQWQLQQKQG